MKKLAGGLYGALLLEKTDEIFYALEDVARGHRTNGTDAESFLYDGRSSYIGQLHRTYLVCESAGEAALCDM